ncbi:hypothetical protein VPJ68_03425, partial [Parabacteroides distasonis]
AFSLSSQISLKGYNQEKIDPSLFEGRWKARWISYPGEAPNVYGVYHFVPAFSLECGCKSSVIKHNLQTFPVLFFKFFSRG